MAATRPLFPSPHFSFLKEALLLPARNPGLFGPILALIVAEKALHVSLAMLPLHEAHDVILVGALSLITSVTVSPVVRAITTIAAVTAYGVDNEEETLAFLQVLRRLFDGGGQTAVGPVVATAVHGQVIAVACQLGVAAMLFLADLLVRYTRTLLLLDLVLVLLVSRLALLYLGGVVVSVAVVVSASEPAGCHRAAALRRAWVITANNAGRAVILLVANAVLAAPISPRRTTASREPMDLIHLLVCSVAQVLSVCAVTAYYNDCRHRVQGRGAEELLLIETGKEWLNSQVLRCHNKLQEVLQGRFSMRHVLATHLARLQRLCTWMLAFVSTHPWVASVAVVCASRLTAEGPPSIVYRNGLVSYRNYLKKKYHIYPKDCVGRCRG